MRYSPAAGVPVTTSEEAGESGAYRHLTWAGCLFAVAVVVHNSDHLRRGVDAVGRDVFWLGTLGIVVEVGIVFLIFQRNRMAPVAAAAGGTALALGYVLVHFLPHHPWFSDSFVSERGISALSWFAASFEVVAALLLAVAGAEVMTAIKGSGGAPGIAASS